MNVRYSAATWCDYHRRLPVPRLARHRGLNQQARPCAAVCFVRGRWLGLVIRHRSSLMPGREDAASLLVDSVASGMAGCPLLGIADGQLDPAAG
jgi:hypothetical protein